MTLARILGQEKMFDHEILPSRFVADIVVQRVHIWLPLSHSSLVKMTNDYFVKNSSKFMSSLVTIVQAARVEGSTEESGLDSPTASNSAAWSGCD